MITYVNTVFVSNVNAAIVSNAANITKENKGKFVIMDCTEGSSNGYIASVGDGVEKFKIGMITGKENMDNEGNAVADIKWSNIINVADIKGAHKLSYEADTEDVVEIDFSSIDNELLKKFKEGGKRIIVRLTFKDLPTRFRKWTESFEYVTPEDATLTGAKIADDIAAIITKQWKRARVTATSAAGVLTLTAKAYDDDNSVDSLNWANKMRFNANVYYTDPAADGWESLNKNFPKGVSIEKTPGKTYAASAKLVRDRESQAMGYLGILNRGEGTWPIVKPEMETKLDGQYDAITLEFENMYRSADDLFRKTKQTVEIYVKHNAATDTLYNAIMGITPAANPQI